MPSRITTQHKSLQLTHLYIDFAISDKEHLSIEFNHLKLVLQKNGHNKKDIIKTINKHANKATVSDIQPDERILTILPYVKGTTDRIGRILNKHNIRTIFKSPEKIGQILRNPKNQTPPLNSAEVYKILCSCGQRDIHWRNRENDQPTKKRIPI